MLLVTVADFVVAFGLALWLRALIRSRGGRIPCTGRQVEPLLVIAACLVLVGEAVANVLVLKALDELGGPRHLDPVLFTAWLAGMSASAIVCILAIMTLHTNRTALVWLRMAPPSGLIVRDPSGELEIALVAGGVHAFIVGNGAVGPSLVQYYIEDRARGRTLNLLLPCVLVATRSAKEGEWLSSGVGPIAKGQTRALARYLAPHCTKV